MARRDTLWLVGSLAIVAGGIFKSRPNVARKAISGEGKASGDVIAYVTDPKGLVLVSTPGGDVDFGVPRLAPSRVGEFHAMVSKWEPLVAQIEPDFRVPKSLIYAIMWSESGGNASKTHANQNGSIDAGLMQVNQVNWGGRSQADMLNPTTNLKVSLSLLEAARAGGSFDLPRTASVYNAGKRPDGQPWTNQDRPAIATRWGFASSPGYIDAVVAASNTYLQDFEGVS